MWFWKQKRNATMKIRPLQICKRNYSWCDSSTVTRSSITRPKNSKLIWNRQMYSLMIRSNLILQQLYQKQRSKVRYLVIRHLKLLKRANPIYSATVRRRLPRTWILSARYSLNIAPRITMTVKTLKLNEMGRSAILLVQKHKKLFRLTLMY